MRDETTADGRLFMDFVSEEYLPHVRATQEPASAWADEARATALVWEFGGLTVPEITDERVEAFRARNAGVPPAVVELYLTLLNRILAKAAERDRFSELEPAGRA